MFSVDGIRRFSKRILKKININPPLREDGTIRYWHIPFTGYSKDRYFIWTLRAELKSALDIFFNGIGEEEIDFNDEYKQSDNLEEGSLKKIFVNKYERNKIARDKCLEYYGFLCTICNFNFEKVYGVIGKNKIHVHHIKPLSRIICIFNN